MIINKRRLLAAALAAVFLVCVFTGCKGETQAAASSNNPGKTIHYGYITADQLHSPAVMVMKEKKLLEAAGFNVEWHEYANGAQAIQDMLAGTIEFANCGVVPIIINQSQGEKLAIIAGSNQEGSSLVVTDSIQTIADLDGKTISTPGLGSIQDALLTQLALTNDIYIDRTTMDIADMPDFLKKNEIDGFIAWAPHPTKAVDNGIGHEILASHDMMPGHQCCVMVTEEKTLAGDSETVEKVLEVYLEAYRWFLDNEDESIKMIAKTTGTSEAVINQAITTVIYSYPPSCNVDSMVKVTQGLIDAGRVTDLKETELGAFIDGLYRPELMEKK